MLSCSLILPVLSSHPFKASSHGGVLVTPFLFPSYFDKYSQKFYSLTRLMKPLYASFLRKFQCGPRVSIRYHGFLPFFLLSAGPPDVLSPRACWSCGSPAPLLPLPRTLSLEDCVFNLWHGFSFLIVNRPLTLHLENDPGLVCSPSLLSLHSLALCCMHAHASSKIKSWKWVYKLTFEQYGSQGH